MKNKKFTRIEMTDEQLLILDKLFRQTEKEPAKYLLLGQVKDDGIGRFALFTPEDLIEQAQKIILQRDTIMPA